MDNYLFDYKTCDIYQLPSPTVGKISNTFCAKAYN